MARNSPGTTDRLPGLLQVMTLLGGGVVAAIGARRLEEAYPLPVGIELFVGTPVWAWCLFWLGIGLVVLGLGMTGQSALAPLALVGFSQQQLSGLRISGLVLCVPVVAAVAGVTFGAHLLLLVTVPSGTAGVVSVVLWRLAELAKRVLEGCDP